MSPGSSCACQWVACRGRPERRRGGEETSAVSSARALELSSRNDRSLKQAGINRACEPQSASVGELDLQLGRRTRIENRYGHKGSGLGPSTELLPVSEHLERATMSVLFLV